MFHYHPFGWQLNTRSFSSDVYRFGFNGKENDADFGNQNIQDYGFRIYNPSIGKFLSVDPLSPEYPMLTPYQFASNSPIINIDLDSLEGTRYDITWSDPGITRVIDKGLVTEQQVKEHYRKPMAIAGGVMAVGVLGVAGHAAVSSTYSWWLLNPAAGLEVVKETGAFVYGAADQTGTDVPMSFGDEAGRSTRAAVETIRQSSSKTKNLVRSAKSMANENTAKKILESP